MPCRPKEKTDVDVVPYLSIMVIVLKLICLILIVSVMRIALNPRKAEFVELGVPASPAGPAHPLKAPTYLDCRPEGVIIYPGEHRVATSAFGQPGDLLATTVNRIAMDRSNQCVVLLVRPGSVHVYRHVRRMLSARAVDVGYDAFDAGTAIRYASATRATD
jgi:hypothetical protein